MTAMLSGLIPASFADAKLTKNGFENLFHIGCADYFPDRA
jgi:hypothetical protein